MVKNSLLVLAVLYAAFISLGLPDQAFGIAWPFMRQDFGLGLDKAGIVVALNSIIGGSAGFCSGYFIRRYKTSTILIASALLTAAAMFGYGMAPGFWLVIAATVLAGAGAGTIDASLNNYMAENYSSRHLIWLHGFYGVGAAAGPAIMTIAVAGNENWRVGYLAIALIQFGLAVLFMSTAGVWKQLGDKTANHFESNRKYRLFSSEPVMSMAVFMIESTLCSCLNVWYYSLMVDGRGVMPATAGTMVVIFWAAMMGGRFGLGLWAPRLSNRRILQYSLTGVLCGLLFLWADNIYLTACGMFITGAALSGLYPTLMHETPRRFGSDFAKAMTGYQAGASMLGGVALFPLVGVIVSRNGLTLLPAVLTAMAAAACFFVWKVYLRKRGQ